MRNEDSGEHKRNAAYETPEDGLGKIVVRRCAFGGTDTVACGRTDPDH